MNNLVSVENCPVCKNKTYKVIHRKEEFQLRVCSICSLVYLSPRLSNIAEVYLDNMSSSPSKYYELSHKYDSETFNKRLDLIEKFSQKGKLLDIGCSTGTMLEIAEMHGWKALGIEPNPISSEICRSKKLNVYNGFFEKTFINSVTSNFDAVYMGDVIEHVPNPAEIIELSLKSLKIGGILMIVTPNFESLVARIFQIKPLEHILYFTQNSIKYLLQNFDTKIELLTRTTRKRSIKAL